MQVTARSPSAYSAPAAPHAPLAAADVPRFDFYGPSHKGLRWALASLLTRLGTCAWNDARSAQMALDDLEGVLYMFGNHAGHEDRTVQLALEARRAGSTASTGGAHERQERMIADLRALAAGYVAAPSSAQPGLWRTLYLRYAEFAGENLMHMSEEELVQQPLLEALYSEGEVLEIHRRLLGAIGPEERFAFTRVMILGATQDERLALLGKLESVMPPPVLASLLKAVQPGLPPAEFEALSARSK